MVIRTDAPSSPSQLRPASFLARIFWMPIGNGLLFILLAVIYQKAHGWAMSGADWVYWLILGLMVAVRFVDITWWNGETVNSVRATRGDFWRYAVLLAVVWGAAWTAVHGLKMALQQ